MAHLFDPAYVLMNRFKYAQKFIAIGLLIALPMAATLYYLFGSLGTDIEVARLERSGLAYNRVLQQFVGGVQSERGGISADGPQMETVIPAMGQKDRESGRELDTDDRWQTLAAKRQELSGQPSSAAAARQTGYTGLIADSLALMAHVGDTSNLILDPALESYYLMDSTLNRLPVLSEQIHQVRDMSRGFIERRTVTNEERNTLIYKLAVMETTLDAIHAGAAVIYAQKPELRPTLEPVLLENRKAVDQWLEQVRTRLVQPAAIGGTYEELAGFARQALASNDRVYEQQALALDQLLADRMAHYQTIQVVVLCIVLVFILLLGYAFGGFYLSIMRTVKQIERTSQEIGAGNLRGRLALPTRDEMQQVALSFNAMIESVAGIIHRSKLTSQDATQTAERLARISELTTLSSRQIAYAIRETASGAELQLQGTEDSSRSIEEMARGLGRIAESTAIASEASQHSISHAEGGQRLIAQVNRQMKRIEETVDDSGNTMARLNEHVQRIGSIAQVMKDISAQTHLLALNASIEAARVGELGSGFAVVAQETRKLAAQSAESAEGISGLIRHVQEESRRSVDAMGRTQGEVRAGLRIVDESGQAFRLIFDTAQQIAEQVQDISVSSEEMAAGSEEVTATIQDIAGITRESAHRLGSIRDTSVQQTASIEELSEMAQALNDMAHRLRSDINKFEV